MPFISTHLMRGVGDRKYMRWILKAGSAHVAPLMLARVQAEIGKWIHGDENIADVCINLVGFESLL